MPSESKRGGKREGSGRKPGAGRVATNSSITMMPELWDKLDAIRGEKSRSAWIAEKVKNARK